MYLPRSGPRTVTIKLNKPISPVRLFRGNYKRNTVRRSAYVKGFGCRRVASGRPGKEPGSESLRRRNPRESNERLAVYGDLARQELWQGMVFAGSLKAESR